MLSRVLVIAILSVLLVNCVAREKVVYLNDIDAVNQKVVNPYAASIRPNDVLGITVSSSNMESVQDFNKYPAVNPFGTSNNNQTAQPQGYLVDDAGEIKFPVIGMIKAAGLKRAELENKIAKKIAIYSKDALVDVRILNYKITILGEVNAPGTYNVNDERVTIFQAISLAGDLTITGQRQNVLLLRDVDGMQESYRLDLTSADLLSSPHYYLQQNDVLYIEPSQNQINATAVGRNTNILISIASFLLTAVLLFTR